MKKELQRIVKDAKELIQGTSDQDNPKRKILLLRAKKAIETFELTMSKLLQ